VSERQLALLAVMILRGPQTLGELRIRTARMAEFSDLNDLERELGRLSGLETPLVERQARRPGQKEDRYSHLLGSGPAGETPGWDESAHAVWSETLDGARVGTNAIRDSTSRLGDLATHRSQSYAKKLQSCGQRWPTTAPPTG
jgi:uncharacterized protein YceH (UPF0502 family)